ncbi:MAG TPA: efflux RND transporter periplasmic adaptor subunit [Thermoanaerobaculia bacterium]|nr:efflux RND transporter periplasmic adaptor subunit [Thermoanaerobaculia bacterium]
MSTPMSQQKDSEPRTKPDLAVLRMEDEERTQTRSRWPLWILLAVAVVVAAVMLVPRLPLPWLLPAVETTTVQLVTPTQESTVLNATGYTYARTRAAVGARIIGRVVELRVDEGDPIRRGDVIAVLDSADLEAASRQAEAALAEARARLAYAEREERRQRALVDAGINAQAQLDTAVTQRAVAAAVVDTAQARVDSVEAQLAYTVIHSPIDGVVIERNVEVGEMVAPGGFTSQQSTGSIVRIADPSSLEIEADINESYISKLELGQPTSIKVDAVPDATYHGRLRQIVPTADRQRAVVEVKVTVDDRDERLVPDMSCTVTFLAEGTDAERLERPPRLLVDPAAIVERDGARIAYRVAGGRVERVAVAVAEGPAGDQRVEVTSGLRAGDVVVVDPGEELEDGARVRTAD